jgi:acetyltransferase
MFMYTSHVEAAQQHRMFCRPICTGFGEITVRPLGPADDVLAQAFVTGLSGTSRYLRFFQVLQGLSPAMLERFTRVDHVTMALAGFANVDGTPSMVAEARYAVGADGTSAEIALVVTDQWQHRGLATELMARLECIAVAAGITRLTGECFAVNVGFASLARSLGFQVRPDPDDRTLLQVEKFIGEQARAGSSRYAHGTTVRPGRTGGWEVAAAF